MKTSLTSSLALSALRPVALASWLAATAGTVALAPPIAHAQPSSSPAAGARSYRIAAGPLGPALSNFAGQSGITLAFTPDQANNLRTPGVQGTYGVTQALAQLLTGTGLQAVAREGGAYTLRSAPAVAAATAATAPSLAEVRVAAQRVYNDSTTEGTGSYTAAGPSTLVTGLSLSLRETPQSVTVFTRAQIEDQALYNLPAVLKQTPGINFEQADSERFSIFSRGFGVDSFLVDGMPMSSHAAGAYELLYQSQMDMVAFDRVEIVKGATGLMRGAGSPSASVNMVRKRPTKELQATAQATLGSWNLRRLEGDISGPLNEAASVRGRVAMVDEKSDSHVDRYNRDKKSVFAVVEADITSATTLSVSANHMDNTVNGMPFNGAVPMFYRDGTRIDLPRTWSQVPSWSRWHSKSTFLGADLEHHLDSEWVAKLSYSNQRSDSTLTGLTWDGYPDRDGSGRKGWRDAYLDDTRRDSWRLNVSGPFDLLGRRHDAMFGAGTVDSKLTTDAYYDWDGYSPTNFFAEAASVPSLAQTQRVWVDTTVLHTREKNAYGAVRLRPSDELSVILGTRVSNWSTDNSSTTRNVNPNTVITTAYKHNNVLTSYVGAVLDLNANYSVYASYTDIFTPQNYRDARGDLIGPVDGSAYEAGLKGAFYDKKLNTTMAVYRVKQNNLGESTGEMFNGQPIYVGIPGAVATGIEAEIAGELQPGWQIQAGLGHNTVRDANGNAALTNSARNTFKLFTTYRLPGQWAQLTLGGGVRWQSSTYRDGAGPNNDKVLGTSDDRLEQPAYSVVDLMANYKISRKMSLVLNLNNLFDKSYITTLRQGAQYGSPRSISASLRVRY